LRYTGQLYGRIADGRLAINPIACGSARGFWKVSTLVT
jgi:hypothetical protein